MKKISYLIIFMFSLLLVNGCGCSKDKNEIVNVYVPDGAPALAIAKLLNDNYTEKNYDVKYHIVNSSTITTHVANGDADIAILPTNAAANLYNKGTKINIVASNTWGLLYMVGSSDNSAAITDLNILKGQVIGIIGQNQVPDLVFKHILKSHNIEYIESDTATNGKVALKYVTDGPSMIPLLKTNMLKYGILGEPAATNSVAKANTSIVLDIQEEWKNVTNSTNSYPQASLIVKSDFLSNNKNFIENMLEEIDLSGSWILDNVDKLEQIMKNYGSTTSAMYTREIIERCNIRLVKNEEMSTAVNKFLEALYDVIPNSIGNKLPDEKFYYSFN